MLDITLSALIGEMIPTLEANSDIDTYASSKLANPENPMKVDLITDKILMNSNLKPVYDPIAFSNGIPTEGGLFSETIFGQTLEDKKRQYAYIDLNDLFFHPYVYEVLKFMLPKRFDKCASGKGAWTIDKEGSLVEITDKDNPNYNTDNSGISWLIRNYHKLKFTKSNSMIRSDRIRFLNSLSDDEIFISKWTVIPIIYRDVDQRKGTHVLPELNDHYNSIIRYSNSLKDSTFDFFNNEVKYNLQKELIAIRQYGQQLLEKKTGFFHRFILGKSIDRGSRDVISVQSFVNVKRPEESPVDIEHTGIPLAKCLILGYNFILRYVLKFFEDNFRNMKDYPVYQLKDGEYKIVGSIKIKNPVEKYDAKYVEKKINRFKNSHGTRFELVTIEAENGTEIPLHMSGQFAPLAPKKYKASTILNRPMTWTDLFYQSAVETLSDKYVYITRYPISSYNSIFPSLCRPLSTIDTVPAIINSVEYRWYPVIDLNTPTGKISNLFNDTVCMSDLYLDALGGDFDGDQTSQKLCFSLEANAEAEKLAHSPTNFVTPDGKLLRVLGKEAYLTFFNLTRTEPVGKILKDEDKKALLALDSKSINIDDLTKLIGYSTKMEKDENGKNKKFVTIEPRFNLRDKFVLEANEYINQTQVNTTVGIFLFNKLMVEPYISNIVPNGYYNEVCNKKVFGKLSDMVAKAILDKKLDINTQVIPWLNAYEFWGLNLVTIVSPSFSMELITPNKELMALKEKLLAEAPDKSLNALTSIEAQLVKKADELTRGTPGKYLFDSGARGSFANDFKNMSISIGVVENPVTNDYDFMNSNYISGISKEDIPAAANSIVNAEYPKAIKTAEGGYMSKQLFAANQNIEVDEEGTDCGSINGLTVVLTKDNLSDYIDQYIMDGKKLVLIDEKLPNTYMNHPVKLRSPMYCLSKKICNKCAGERFYKVGIQRIGLSSSSLAGALQAQTLKARHDLSIKVDKIDENTILL